MSPRMNRHLSQGFSLLEALVAMLIVSLGLLGVSKMQAAALSNTQVARTRALIALQASSLAAAMHGNRRYWGDLAAPLNVSMTATTVTDPSGVLSATAVCNGETVCTHEQVAAYDLQTWASNLNDRFPSYHATIACAARTTNTPSSCLIKVDWNEKYVAINRSTASAAGAAQTANQFFSLLVEP